MTGSCLAEDGLRTPTVVLSSIPVVLSASSPDVSVPVSAVDVLMSDEEMSISQLLSAKQLEQQQLSLSGAELLSGSGTPVSVSDDDVCAVDEPCPLSVPSENRSDKESRSSTIISGYCKNSDLPSLLNSDLSHMAQPQPDDVASQVGSCQASFYNGVVESSCCPWNSHGLVTDIRKCRTHFRILKKLLQRRRILCTVCSFDI
ncbi:uncharacterized protein V6R79_001313 [Siganus canaliculatus]